MGLQGFLGGVVGAPFEALGMDPGRIPLIGSLFGTDEEKAAQQSFQDVANRYRQLRPELAQSRSNALGQQLEALRPSNAMVGAMAGGDPSMQIDFGKIAQSPMTPGLVGGPPSPGQQASVHDALMSAFGPAYGPGMVDAMKRRGM